MAAEVQAAKQLIWDVFSGARSTPLHPDVEFHGPAPIGRLDGAAVVREAMDVPLAAGLEQQRWEPYVFLGGVWNGDEVWVAHTGHLTGTFSRPLFGIRLTGAVTSLRYGHFARVEGSEIVEVRVLLDIVAFAARAGLHLLPEPPLRNRLPPPPVASNGVVRSESDAAGGPIGQNIMDFYVRRGPKLHENWVLIDLIDFAAQRGVDLLADLA